MRHFSIITLFLLSSFAIVAQQKLTVEEIYTGAFRAKGMDELQSMKNTNQYTVLNSDRAAKSQQIDLYDFATLQKVSTLIDTKNHKELIDGIDSCLLYTSPSPRDRQKSRMPSSA